MAEGEKIIGIDLGTTNSVVAVMEGKEAKVIPNQEGNRLTPSVVAFTDKGDVLVGEPARRQAVTNPDRHGLLDQAVHGPPAQRSRRAKRRWSPTRSSAGRATTSRSRSTTRNTRRRRSRRMILRKLKEAAESYLGHKVNKAVITVPAYFNDAQRQATKDAGQIAGLEVARIINEPTAAALAYGLDRKKNEKIVVFDLGGGTFDISILEVADGVFQVISTNGDTHLGGDDFDEVLINYVADEFKKEQRHRPAQGHDGPAAAARSREKAKKELSSASTTDINLPFITADANGPKHLQMSITPQQVRAAGRSPDRALPRPGDAGAEGRQAEAQRDRRGRAGRRLDPHAQGAGARQEDLRQGAAQGRQPRRGRGHRRGDPGRRAGRRSQGRAAARRHPAVAGHRDRGRRDDQARRAEHHDSRPSESRPSAPPTTTRRP